MGPVRTSFHARLRQGRWRGDDRLLYHRRLGADWRAPAPARKRAGVQPGEKRPMISKQPGMDVPAVGYEKAALQLPGSQRRL